MERKGLISLGLISVAMALAYGFYAARQAPTELRAAGALLPELNLAALNVIAFEHDGQSIRLERKDGVWVIPAKGDYAAAGKPVAELLQRLKDAKKLEARTANPELHARLGLAETGSEQEQAGRLTLEAEQTFALLLGNRSGQDGQLMRVRGDNQTWVVTPALSMPTDVQVWLDRRVTEIDFAQIKSVAVTLKDGERFEVVREENQPNMQVVGLTDAQVAYETAANGMARVFERLQFADAKAKAELTLQEQARFVLTTLSEQTLEGALHQSGDQYWLVITNQKGFAKAEIPAPEGWAFALESRHYQALTHNLKAVLKP